MTLFRLPQALDAETSLAAWIDRGIVAAVLLACGVALSLNVADPDLWGHVQYGRDALRHGLPATTTYSYVAEGYPWINHEILAEYALAIGADTLGSSGLLLAKCLLGLAIMGAIFFRSRASGVGLVAACSLALLVAVTLGNHWSLRPQLISYASFALLLAILSYAFHGWEGSWQFSWQGLRRLLEELAQDDDVVALQPCSFRGRVARTAKWVVAGFCRTLLALTPALSQREREVGTGQLTDSPPPLEYSLSRLKALWLVPPLMVVWTNSHGGFLAGLCVYWAYLALRGLEALTRKGRAADGLIVRFACMGGVAGLATFLNPYGPRFHVWLFHDLKVPRPEIVEWRAPELLNSQFLPFWLLVVAGAGAVVFSRKSRDLTHLVILGLILWQALTHHRHIAFLAIAAGWWLPLHWNSLLERLGIGARFKSDEELRFGWSPPEDPAFAAAFSPLVQRVVALLVLGAIGLCGFQLISRLASIRVYRDEYPVSAVEYIAHRQLTGKMVCTFNWAQYVLAALGPRDGRPGILVQIDGRCRTSYSQEMLDQHFDFLMGDAGPDVRYRDPRSGPFDPERVLEVNRPDLVLISRLQEPSCEVMRRQGGRWVLLYEDSLAELWGRASKYDESASRYYIRPTDRIRRDLPQAGWVRWPALPQTT